MPTLYLLNRKQTHMKNIIIIGFMMSSFFFYLSNQVADVYISELKQEIENIKKERDKYKINHDNMEQRYNEFIK